MDREKNRQAVSDSVSFQLLVLQFAKESSKGIEPDYNSDFLLDFAFFIAVTINTRVTVEVGLKLER